GPVGMAGRDHSRDFSARGRLGLHRFRTVVRERREERVGTERDAERCREARRPGSVVVPDYAAARRRVGVRVVRTIFTIESVVRIAATTMKKATMSWKMSESSQPRM